MLKIKKEELELLQKQQTDKQTLLNAIGIAEAQKHDLLHGLSRLMQKIKETADTLEKEYGKINVNLEDGTYEEVKEKETIKE